MSKTAHIIAIRAGSLGDLGFGISAHPGDVEHILTEGEVWVGPRPVLETDFDFVQPIPYIVLRKGSQVLAYRRGEAGGEGRLHGKVSVGVGGHIDAADVEYSDDGSIALRNTLAAAAVREIQEEVGLSVSTASLAWTHVISSDTSAVDEVHIGLVAQIDMKDVPLGRTLDPELCMENVAWREPADLLAEHEASTIQLESWSLLALGAIVNSQVHR